MKLETDELSLLLVLDKKCGLLQFKSTCEIGNMELEDLLIDDDLDINDIVLDGFPRRWNERDYFEALDDLSFFRRFRLTKPTVVNLLEEVENALTYDNRVNNPVNPMNQLLLALRFYASNGHQVAVGDFMGCHQTTACRIINKVSRVIVIANLRPLYVRMPQNELERIQTQEEFYRISRFPRVIGVIDGTHIKIQSPGGDDPEIFRNREGYFSINTQIIGNAKLEVTDIVARWPGSSHDATIFNNSRILARFEANEFGQGLLLGDSGYGLRKFLLTPLLNPQTRGEQLYNESHIRTRNVIERINGILKRRFPVLAYGLRCKVENALPIIVATTVLHNIAHRMGEQVLPLAEGIDKDVLNYLIEQGNIPVMPEENNNRPNPINHRQQLIDQFFNNLD